MGKGCGMRQESHSKKNLKSTDKIHLIPSLKNSIQRHHLRQENLG
jgi:hypothetical protein